MGIEFFVDCVLKVWMFLFCIMFDDWDCNEFWSLIVLFIEFGLVILYSVVVECVNLSVDLLNKFLICWVCVFIKLSFLFLVRFGGIGFRNRGEFLKFKLLILLEGE